MSKEQINGQTLRELYRKIFLLRHAEQKINTLFMQGLVPGTLHLYIGEEASAVGVIDHLTDKDRVFLTHRPHGGALAKGMEPKRLFAEVLGRADGCMHGKGGSMHLIDIDKGIMPANPIIGAGIVIANGVAMVEKQKAYPSMTVSFFGDGCSNIGAFHEGLNFASINKLPVLFVCENNLYAVSTRISKTCLLENISDRAKAYGMRGMTVDGNDVEAVWFAAKEALEHIRAGNGPVLLETKTYRHLGHSRIDPGTYRPKEEVAKWKAYDPVDICRDKLLQRGVCSEDELAELEQGVTAIIEEGAEFAKNSPLPDPDSALRHAYAG